MENIKKIIKVFKVLESVFSVNYNLDSNFKENVEHSRDVLEDVYGLVEDLGIVKGQLENERLIASFLINFELCNGDWDKFLTGELKLEKPSLKEYIVTHDFTGTYHVTETAKVEAYFISSAYWDMEEHGLDYEIDDMNLIDIYDSEYVVKEL
jgi:hypothetical protein